MQRDDIDVRNLSLLHRMGNPFEEEVWLVHFFPRNLPYCFQNTITLLDLPREILVKVVEQSSITLEVNGPEIMNLLSHNVKKH